MPSTGTRKKKSTAGRKTTRKKTPSAKKRQKQAYNRELVTEITILIRLDGLSVSGSSVYGNCICYRKL